MVMSLMLLLQLLLLVLLLVMLTLMHRWNPRQTAPAPLAALLQAKRRARKRKTERAKAANTKRTTQKSQKKQAKKEAKAKAAAAASEKAEAASKKKHDKDQMVAKKLCDAVVTKCEGVSLTLAATLADPGTALLPDPVLQSCKRSLEVVEGIVKRAKLIIAQEMPAADLGISKAQAVLIISNPILS